MNIKSISLSCLLFGCTLLGMAAIVPSTVSSYELVFYEKVGGSITIDGDILTVTAGSDDQLVIVRVQDSGNNTVILETDIYESVWSTSIAALPSGTYTVQVLTENGGFSDQFTK